MLNATYPITQNEQQAPPKPDPLLGILILGLGVWGLWALIKSK